MVRMDPASGVGYVELPTGWLAPDGTLHKEVTIREMTGRDEDMLASDSVPVVRRLNAVMAGCTLAVGDVNDRTTIEKAVLDMPSGDRMALLVGLRILSHGPMYDMLVTCDRCSNEGKATVNLEEFETEAPEDPSVRTFTETMPPGCKYKTVQWAVLTGHSDSLLEELREKVQDSDMTLHLLARLRKLDDKEVSFRSKGAIREVVEAVKDLRSRDYDFLRTKFAEREGGVDMSFEFRCPKCKKDLKGRVNVGQPGFFFPSVT